MHCRRQISQLTMYDVRKVCNNNPTVKTQLLSCIKLFRPVLLQVRLFLMNKNILSRSFPPVLYVCSSRLSKLILFVWLSP
jgi:hypothetical protein